MSNGGGQDWGSLAYLAAVGAVTLLMDWIRRRVMRREDELDAEARRKGNRHRSSHRSAGQAAPAVGRSPGRRLARYTVVGMKILSMEFLEAATERALKTAGQCGLFALGVQQWTAVGDVANAGEALGVGLLFGLVSSYLTSLASAGVGWH